jgi:hypothetical protein
VPRKIRRKSMTKKTKALAYDNGIVVDVDAGPSRTWATSPGMYLAGRAAIDAADAMAHECERRWGVGRLRLLVPIELREKFDRQRYLLNQAIWHGDLEAVRREAGRMVTAWRAVERAADQAGHMPINPQVWETTLSDGTVVGIVRDIADAHAAMPEGRKMAIYTLSEITTLLESHSLVNRVKIAFQGARVEKATLMPGDPLNAFSDSRRPLDEPFSLDEELPF